MEISLGLVLLQVQCSCTYKKTDGSSCNDETKTTTCRISCSFVLSVNVQKRIPPPFKLANFDGMASSWERTATYGTKGIDPDARFGYFRFVPGSNPIHKFMWYLSFVINAFLYSIGCGKPSGF